MRATKSHTVRAADGGTVELNGYGRRLAILSHCTECCGWEMHPRDCTAVNCALYPYRGLTSKTRASESQAKSAGESPSEAIGDNPTAPNTLNLPRPRMASSPTKSRPGDNQGESNQRNGFNDGGSLTAGPPESQPLEFDVRKEAGA